MKVYKYLIVGFFIAALATTVIYSQLGIKLPDHSAPFLGAPMSAQIAGMVEKQTGHKSIYEIIDEELGWFIFDQNDGDILLVANPSRDWRIDLTELIKVTDKDFWRQPEPIDLILKYEPSRRFTEGGPLLGGWKVGAYTVRARPDLPVHLKGDFLHVPRTEGGASAEGNLVFSKKVQVSRSGGKLVVEEM